jgi:hypothetical protein
MNDELLRDIAASLKAIAASMSTDDGLGFQRQEVTVLYCNPGDDSKGWYTLTPPDGSGQRQRLHQPPSIKGCVKDLKFVTPEGRKRESTKLRFYLDCGCAGLFILEAGAETAFTRSLLSSLAAVEDVAKLQRPITIFSYVSDRDALFTSITLEDGTKPRMDWTSDSDWRAIATTAKSNIYQATGRELPQEQEPRSPVSPPPVRKRPGVTWSPSPLSRQPEAQQTELNTPVAVAPVGGGVSDPTWDDDPPL